MNKPAMSGNECVTMLDALTEFIKEHFPEATPAEVCFTLHQLAWTYHWGFDQKVK